MRGNTEMTLLDDYVHTLHDRQVDEESKHENPNEITPTDEPMKDLMNCSAATPKFVNAHSNLSIQSGRYKSYRKILNTSPFKGMMFNSIEFVKNAPSETSHRMRYLPDSRKQKIKKMATLRVQRKITFQSSVDKSDD
jgi:hypothetical protein